MSKDHNKQPRASHYGPPAVYELDRAGVLEEIRDQGFKPEVACWRALNGTFLAGLDGTVLGDYPHSLTCLQLDKVSKIIHDHFSKQPSVKISWKHKVVAIGQDEETS